MKTILILALDGIMDSSLAIARDIFNTGRAFLAKSGKPHEVRIITAGYSKTLRTGAGLRLSADITFKQVLESGMRPDWVVIPGGGLINGPEIGARLEQKDALDLIRLLQQIDNGKVRIAAACSSVFLLAQSGLLAGRDATTTWWLAHLFRARFPDIKLDETRMLVSDGPYLTAGAAFSQLDLALSIVADTMGNAIAHLCTRYMLIDERPSQARYMIQTHIRDIDPTVVAAERWIDEHLSEPISVAELSSQLAVSPKTLTRRLLGATGISPIKFIQRRRLMRASHLIETTSQSIEAIAAQVGYQDGTALRKLIKREFGVTPSAMR